MRDLSLICILLSILLVSCSTPKNYYIDSAWQNEKNSTSMLILPIGKEWFDSSTIHTFSNLYGNGKSIFYSSLSGLFAEHISSDIKTIDREQEFPDTLFELTSLNTGKTDFEVMTPREDAKIEISNFSARIILVLDQSYYREKEEMVGGSTYAGHESESKNFLYFETKYVFWDTQNSEPIAWGVSDATVQISKTKSPTGADYQKVLSRAIDKIVKRGPVI